MALRGLVVVAAVLALAISTDVPPTIALQKGDANCDGGVTTDDGLDVLEYKARVGPGSPCLQMADANCDGVLDQIDVLAIFVYLADPVASPGPCAGVGATPQNGQVYAEPVYIDSLGDGLTPREVGPSDIGDMIVGDNGGGDQAPNANTTRRVTIIFPVGAIEGDIDSATLTLAVTETRRDQYPDPGSIDGNAPYDNPQIGDLQVVHVPDPGEATDDDYDSPSAGNDPGVLVVNGAEGPAFKLTIDVTAALQQAIDGDEEVLAFRLQMSVLTDDDGLNDTWGFWSGNNRILDRRPTLAYTLAA
jgi:hypothetical protein